MTARKLFYLSNGYLWKKAGGNYQRFCGHSVVQPFAEVWCEQAFFLDEAEEISAQAADTYLNQAFSERFSWTESSR